MANVQSPLAALTKAALAALQANDLDKAVQHFAAARRLAPDQPELLRSLCALYRHLGRPAEAWSAAETGLRLSPDDAGFGDARLAAMEAAGFVQAALTLARDWAAATPGEPSAKHRLGTLLLRTGDHAAALIALQAALTSRPDWPEALTAAAEAAYRAGDRDQARIWLDRAVALEPENRAARMARATILLSLGIWEPGLRDYEFRLLPSPLQQIERRHLTAPRWQGEDLADHTLLVLAEQGIGDQIRFARDLILLQGLCGRLIVECTPRLVPLLRRALPARVLVAASVERQENRRHVFDYGWLAAHGPVDFYIEAGSLLLRLFERGIMPDRSSA